MSTVGIVALSLVGGCLYVGFCSLVGKLLKYRGTTDTTKWDK